MKSLSRRLPNLGQNHQPKTLNIFGHNKKMVLAIGLMSGTSLDGITAALVKFEEDEKTGVVKANVIKYLTVPFSRELKARLNKLMPGMDGTIDDLAYCHFYLGKLFAQAAKKVAEEAGVELSSVDVIGSHGLTVRNLPERDEAHPHSRLQIGSIDFISKTTGVTTVGDFRPAEVAVGGEGAPLISFPDYKIFRHPEENRVLLNIGGIANVTYLPAGCTIDDVLAFDTGPGNMLIDKVVFEITKGEMDYDKDGQIAASGKIDQSLLDWLMEHPFIKKKPPKSAGREEFGEKFKQEVLRIAAEKGIDPKDLVATLTAFTARSIAWNCRTFLGKIDELIAAGGGSRNKTLMKMLQEEMGCRISTTDAYGVPSEAREAVGFALLAWYTLQKKPNNAPKATGASRPTVMGHISWGI
jgi:anhydro-N-acetylmuramic acid kinase